MRLQILALALAFAVPVAVAEEPSLVVDLAPGPASADPRSLRAVGAMLFFAADIPGLGRELCVSDGSAGGTRLVRDIRPGGPGSAPSGFASIGGVAYFVADDGMAGRELWRSDGTAAGTVRIVDLRTGHPSPQIEELVAVGELLFFSAKNPGGAGRELWCSDGTAPGTRLVADLRPGGPGSDPEHLVAFGALVAFVADDGSSGREPWVSDGTAAGTRLVADLAPGRASSHPGPAVVVAGGMIFAAESPATGRELWTSDGTLAGTTLLADVHPGAASPAGHLEALAAGAGGRIWFAGNDGVHGLELWTSDGTVGGTRLVADLTPGPGGSAIDLLTPVASRVFFRRGRRLAVSDGTPGGTRELAEFASDGLGAFAPLGDGVFFSGALAGAGAEPWRSDGSVAGTARVADLWPGAKGSNPLEPTAVGALLVFSAADPARGRELRALVADQPRVTIDVVGGPIAEAGGTALVRASLDRVAATTVTISLSFSGSAGADDLASPGNVIVIEPGASSADLALTALDDAAVEGPETVVIDIVAVRGGIEDGAQQAVTTILDDDVPSVSIAATDASAHEAGDPGRFAVTRTGDTGSALVVGYRVSGGAGHGVDYAALSGAVTIPAGAETADIHVLPIDDTASEESEDVVLTLVPSAAYVVTGAGAAVLIADDDPVAVSIAIEDAMASEAGPDAGSFRVSRSGAAAAPLTIGLAIGGTAEAGEDYVGISAAVTMPAGESSVLVVVMPVTDAVLESSETVALTVLPGSGYVVGAPALAVLAIADRDMPTVSIAASDGLAVESGDTATFVVSRSGGGSVPLIVYYTIGGDATLGADYAAMPASVTISAGTSSQTVVAYPIDDALDEAAETIVLTLSPSLNYTIGTPAQAAATIADDDAPVVTIAAVSAAREPATGGSFRLARSGSTAAALTVALTASGSAAAGADYQALPTTVIFPAGVATVEMAVAVIDDALREPAETVMATLAPGAGYVLGSPGAATLIVADDDTPVASVTAADASATEVGGDHGSFTIARSGPLGDALDVALTTGGTAAASIDYAAIPAVVTIPAGSASVTIAVVAIDDQSAEGIESVVVSVAASGDYEVGAPASATVGIRDDEDAAIAFAPATIIVPERVPSAVATADLDGDGASDIVTADYQRDSVSVLRNLTSVGAAAPTLSPATSHAVAAGPVALAVGDLDGDGDQDLALAAWTASACTVRLNGSTVGTVTFPARLDVACGVNPQHVAVGDLDGDGRLDLVLAINETAEVQVFLAAASSPPTFHPPMAIGGIVARHIAIGDLDGDGRADLAVADPVLDRVTVLPNRTPVGAASAVFAAAVDVTVGSVPYAVAIGDVDGDGRADLLAVNYFDGELSIARNTTLTGAALPRFAAASHHACGRSPAALALADFDGDGWIDIAVANADSAYASVFENTTTAPGASPTLARIDLPLPDAGPDSVAVADVNGDARPDLVLGSSSTGTLAIVLAAGASSGPAPTVAARSSVIVLAPEGESVVDGDCGCGAPASAPATAADAARSDPAAESGVPGGDGPPVGIVLPKASIVSPALVRGAAVSGQPMLLRADGVRIPAHRLGAGWFALAPLAADHPTAIDLRTTKGRTQVTIAWLETPVVGEASVTIPVSSSLLLAFPAGASLDILHECGVSTGVAAGARRVARRFDVLGRYEIAAVGGDGAVLGRLVVVVVGIDSILGSGGDAQRAAASVSGPMIAAECPGPAGPNRGEATANVSELCLTVPESGSAPLEKTFNVLHSIITVDTPRSRNLPGTLNITVKEGDASIVKLTRVSTGAPYVLGTAIPVLETGHSGCGIHDWHTGTEAFRISGVKPGKIVLEASTDPDPDDGGDGVPTKTSTITVHVAQIDITDAYDGDRVLVSPVTTQRVAVKTRLGVKITPAPSSTVTYAWTIGGSPISTYFHDMDEAAELAKPPPAMDLTKEKVEFLWTSATAAGASTDVRIRVTIGTCVFERSPLKFTVTKPADPGREVYALPIAGTSDDTFRRYCPNGPIDRYRVNFAHRRWHGGTATDTGEAPVESGAAWGDAGMGTTAYNGSAFILWHRRVLESHVAWRSKFGFGAIPAAPVPIPLLPTLAKTFQRAPAEPEASRIFGYVRIGEFLDINQVGIEIVSPYHNTGHVRYGGDMGSTATAISAAGDRFWGWHNHIDGIARTWSADRATVVSTIPAHEATPAARPTEIVVVFDLPVSDSGPAENDAKITAGALKVNGVAATAMTTSADPAKANREFTFTVVASAGHNEVTLDGTRGFNGSTAPTPLFTFESP